jgi:hypothetical protein
MQEWRKQGPLGVLVDVINYIKTPQQYELFREFQRAATLSRLLESVLKYSNLLSLLLLAGTRITLPFNTQLNSKLPTTPT